MSQIKTKFITDSAVTNAKVSTGIDAAKIADGSVSNTEFQYLNSVTSDIQTQLNNKLTTSNLLNLNIVDSASASLNTSIGNWVTYADAAGTQPVDGTGGSPNVTVTLETSSPLNGAGSLRLSKDAANRQGQGASLTLSTIPEYIKGLPSKLSFSVKGSSNFDFGTPFDSADPSDVTVYLYDVTNSLLIQPYPYTINSNGIFEGTFQMPSVTSSLRVILHITTTNASAYTLDVDDVQILPALNQEISADSDWETYTPTGAFTTNTTYAGRYRKIGDSAHIRARISFSGAPNAVTNTLTLPTGLTIDTSKLVSTSTTANTFALVGMSKMVNDDASVETENFPGAVAVSGSNTVSALIMDPTSGATHYYRNVNATNVITIAANDYIDFDFIVPVTGWTSSQLTSASANLNAPAVFSGTQASQALTANVTNLSLTATKDSVSGWSTNIYTVKVPGDYTVSLQCGSAGNGTMILYKNGSNFQTLMLVNNNNNGTSVLMPNLVVGDTISFRCTASITITNGYASIYKSELSGRVYSTRKAYVKEVQTSGTQGGTLTSGAYQTRTLNTLEGDTSFVSLASNQFTLQPGTYLIEASAPAFRVDNHKIKLRNITDSTDTLIGVVMHSGNVSDYASSRSIISGTFSITSSKVFEIQHRGQTTRTTNGLGAAATFGDSEIYTQVKLEKVL